MSRPDPTRRTFLAGSALLAAAAATPMVGFGQFAGDRPRKVILDVDLGIDDAFALLLAHYSQAIDLVGITTLFGNASVGTSTRNSLYMKERFGIGAEVHAGAAAPLYEPDRPVPTFVHGEDGLGDVIGRIEPSIRASEPSAPEFIARTILANPGEITLIAVGPCTNLMLARTLEPRIVDLVSEVILMAGAAGFNGEQGNITTVAEANARNDPHAMDALMRHSWPVTMVGLDVTYTADASTTPSYMRQLASQAGEPGAFLEQINRFYTLFYQRTRGVETSFQHDSIAVAYAIAPELFETRRGKLKVITEGVAIGQTVFCPEGHHTFGDPEWAGLPTQTVCSRLDGPGFLELYRRALVDDSRLS